MYGLKIQVDFTTGKRAGNINPRDPGLLCDPTWQNLDSGWEVRVIRDNRDVEQYRNIPGVEVLEGEEAIDAAIAHIFKPRYGITDQALCAESVRQFGIDLTPLKGKSREEVAEALYKAGALGTVAREQPAKVSERIGGNLAL